MTGDIKNISLGTPLKYPLIYLIIERALVGSTMEPLPEQLGWWKCPNCDHPVIRDIDSTSDKLVATCQSEKGGGCGNAYAKSTWIKHNEQTPKEL